MRPIALSQPFATLIALATIAPLASVAAGQASRQDEATALLSARAGRPAEAAPEASLGPIGAGNQLFFMTGPDNAACVRSIADVNGDGIDEVLVGIDESQTDNVFCLDGTSSGAASVVWKIQTADGVSGGAPYGDQCLVAASDSEGNGEPNVLVGTAWGGRTAYDLDGFAGSTVWKYDTYFEVDSGWVYSLCELNDITGDGVPEAAFGTGSFNDSVYLIDGASVGGQAEVLWRYRPGDAAYSVRDLGDVNGDGDHDVLAAIGDDVDEIVCLDGGTSDPAGNVIWKYSPGASVFACGVLPDVTGDGIDEALAVLWTLGGSSIRCLNGATGIVEWSSTEVPQYGQMVDVLADVTGDGEHEVIVSSWENAVIVLDGSDGSLVWKTTVGTTNGGDVWTARAIDDLNGDGRQDVIAGSFDYHVYAMDGDSGEVFWAYNTNNRVFSVHPVGDLNGDGRPEVVAGTQDTNNSTVVHVLEGDADIPFPGLTLDGSGFLGTQLSAEITGPTGYTALPAYSLGTASVVVPKLGGTLGLASPIFFLPRGTIPAGGAYVFSGVIPDDPALVGATFYIQGLAYAAPPLTGEFTDVESVTIRLGD